MTEHDKYYAAETKAQQYRRITPILALLNFIGTYTSGAVVITLLCYGWNNYVKTMDDRMDSIIQNSKDDRTSIWTQIDALHHEIECTKVAVASCCGEKSGVQAC
jgi:hypothetical protein